MVVRRTVMYFNDKQLKKIMARLTKSNFECIGTCQFSQTWINRETGEEKFIIKG